MGIPENYQLIYKTKRNIVFCLGDLLMISLSIPVFFKTIDLFTNGQGISGAKFITVVFFFLFCGIALTHKKVLYTNANSKSLLLRYTFFGFPIINDSFFNEVQFVGVHIEGDLKSKDFTIKLWFLNNKSQAIAYRFNAKSALELGEILSDGLKVNMFDNTDKNQNKWVNKY